MFPRAATVPADSDLLCEACGYTLNGLLGDGQCPECGQPVALSLGESRRTLPLWESGGGFWSTTALVVFRTSAFYRTMRTRVDEAQHARAYGFAVRHWLLAGLMMALASGVHYLLSPGGRLAVGGEGRSIFLLAAWTAVATGIAGVACMALTHVASGLTAWEAGWRGLRLPKAVVLRGLCYHAAHLLPVSAAILAVVIGHRLLWGAGAVGYASVVTYLLVLSGVVVAGAVYLFWTYWLGMRNMLYANL